MKKMKNLKKRVLSILVAAVMCLGMLPVTAFAAEVDDIHNPVTCETCGGTGTLTNILDCPDCGGEIEMINCEKCDGEGMYIMRISHIFDDDYPCPNHGFACNGCADCLFGYAYTYETVDCEVCDGVGQVMGSNDCSTCSGTGKIEESYDCDVCGGIGEVECTDDFDDGELTLNSDGTGTMTYTCTCGASYTEELDHAQVVAILGEDAHILSDEAADHKDPTCTEGGYDVFACTVDGCGETVTVVIEATGHTLDEGVVTKEPTCTEEGVKTYTCSVCGETKDEAIEALGHTKPAEEEITIVSATCADEGSINYICTVCSEEISEPTSKLGHKWYNGTCKNCGAVSVSVTGAFMGRWFGYQSETAKDSRKATLDELVGSALTVDNLIPSADTSTGFWGEFVANYSTSKIWQCVGFIPVIDDVDDLVGNVFTDFEDYGKFVPGSLEDVKNYISENNGLLYGETLNEETLDLWKDTFNSTSGYAKALMSVWFVADTTVKPGQFGEYDPTIQPIESTDKMEMADNSTGTEVHCSNLDTLVYNTANGSYTVDLVVTISADAPDDVHVNLLPGLSEAINVINKLGGFQPGDSMILNVSIDNQSGRRYTYVRNSAFLATVPTQFQDGTALSGIGFDGYGIPVVGYDAYAVIPRRIDNAPLRDLLGTIRSSADLADEAVADALIEKGYENGLDDLANYYLDWTNGVRATQSIAPAHSFGELTMPELAVFTKGNNDIHAFETCASVAEALYYYFYAHDLTYNGLSIYGHMQQYGTGTSELETAISAALAGRDYVQNVFALSGEYTPNAFQNTKMGFRIEFDLSYSRTPTPTPDPDPDPEEPPEEPPEVDIPEPEIPLAPPPDEEIDIPEPEIPLADVPMTGDISDVWFVMIALAAAGLAVLSALESKKSAKA